MGSESGKNISSWGIVEKHTVDLVFYLYCYLHLSISSVQSLSCVYLFATPWTAACQASLSITNS